MPPVSLSSFVGRERELGELGAMSSSSRLLTLTGPAGCGKTRLAVEFSHRFAPQFEAVFWVPLASLQQGDLVEPAVSKALDPNGDPARPLSETVARVLGERRGLVVLDNCEHLVGACRQIAQRCLEMPGLVLVATSREPLAIPGEQRYPVPPLALPNESGTLDEIAQAEVVRLFLDRAKSILPRFELTSDNAELIVAICRRLDALPLAIELVCARLNVLSLAQIEERLGTGLDVLPDASDVSSSPHQTLQAAVAWSYDLLSAAEQRLLRRLSVFARGCGLSAIEEVCAADPSERSDLLDLVASLVDKSLVISSTLLQGEARYSLLETIREFAGGQLQGTGEGDEVRLRHLNYFLQAAEEAAPKLTGKYQQVWVTWLDLEYDNLRGALTLALESGRIAEGLRIAIALYDYWIIRSHVQEGLSWLERFLRGSDASLPLAIRANALAYAGFLSGIRGNTAMQLAYAEEAAAIAEDGGEDARKALMWALACLAWAARAAGDHAKEYELAMREIAVTRELGDPHLLGVTLSVWSPTALATGKYDQARRMLEEALVLLRQSGDSYRIAMALNFTGDLLRCEARYTRARQAYQDSLALLRRLNASRDVASVLHNLGHTHLHLNAPANAAKCFEESLRVQRALDNEAGIAECLIGFAGLASVVGMPGVSVRLLAASASHGARRSGWAATQLEHDRYFNAARAVLTAAEFEAEYEAGTALSLEAAIELAARLAVMASTHRRTSPRGTHALTRRERQVADMIGRGLSNGDIADRLVVSKRTVEKHVANILGALGLTSRAQIVRWAMEQQVREAVSSESDFRAGH